MCILIITTELEEQANAGKVLSSMLSKLLEAAGNSPHTGSVLALLLFALLIPSPQHTAVSPGYLLSPRIKVAYLRPHQEHPGQRDCCKTRGGGHTRWPPPPPGRQ